MGVDTVRAALPLGGMPALRRKSLSLTRLFIGLVQARLQRHGFEIASPLEDDRRGSQVSLSVGEGAYAIVQALIDAGVVGDFRAGAGRAQADLLRFGFCPLYLSHEEVWQAVERLEEIMASNQWRQARYDQRHAVT